MRGTGGGQVFLLLALSEASTSGHTKQAAVRPRPCTLHITLMQPSRHCQMLLLLLPLSAETPPGAKAGWNLAWQTMVKELAPQDKGGSYNRPGYAFDNRIGGSPQFPVSGLAWWLFRGCWRGWGGGRLERPADPGTWLALDLRLESLPTTVNTLAFCFVNTTGCLHVTATQKCVPARKPGATTAG